MAAGVQAILIPVESFDKGLTPYSDPPLSALTSPYIDTAENLNILIDLYNSGDNDPPELPGIVGPYIEKEAPGDFPDEWAGPIILSPGYAYLSLKYGNIVELWYIPGETTFDFDISKGLSHYRLWNPSPVPEPATLLLIGAGMIVIGAFGRKKMVPNK
jgi:hypothetical protein